MGVQYVRAKVKVVRGLLTEKSGNNEFVIPSVILDADKFIYWVTSVTLSYRCV